MLHTKFQGHRSISSGEEDFLIIGQVKRRNRDIFSIFFNMEVCCVVILMSTHNITFLEKRKENHPKLF